MHLAKDQSFPKEANRNSRLRKGTVRQILECAKKPDGKVLNALNFPLPLKSVEPSSLSSDAHAMHQTMNGVGWKHGMPTPTGEIRWGLIATAGAWHPLHIDCDGLGTSVHALNKEKTKEKDNNTQDEDEDFVKYSEYEMGLKLWIVARPKGPNGAKCDFRQFSKIGLFTDARFDLDSPCEDLFDLEAVVLAHGTEL